MRALFISLFCMISFGSFAQITTPDTTQYKNVKLFKVTLNSGKVFVGNIINQDPKEVLIETKEVGQVLIPKYEISLIEEIPEHDLVGGGVYKPSETFATRYFITTNGLPIKKGDSYIQWNLYGPDFQYGVTNHLGIGIMTTWLGVPIIAQGKYSIKLGENVHLGLGGLVGTGSWIASDFGLALPFSSFTIGDRRSNITLSAGYGSVWSEGRSSGRALLSLAGMTKVSKKVSIVFDSFIVPASGNVDDTTRQKRTDLAIFIPGIRWQLSEEKAFQFGFTGISYDGKVFPVVIPMLQWYRKL